MAKALRVSWTSVAEVSMHENLSDVPIEKTSINNDANINVATIVRLQAWVRGWHARRAVVEAHRLYDQYVKHENDKLHAELCRVAAIHIQAIFRGVYVRHTFRQYIEASQPRTCAHVAVRERRQQIEREQSNLDQLGSELAELQSRRKDLEEELNAERGRVAALELLASVQRDRISRSFAAANMVRLVGEVTRSNTGTTNR